MSIVWGFLGGVIGGMVGAFLFVWFFSERSQ